LHDALTEADSDSLKHLLSVQSERVVAVADMLTSRRRHRVVTSLKVTVQLLGDRFEVAWNEYLGRHAPRGVWSAPTEAMAFGNWMLPKLEPQSLETQLLTYELCRSATAERLRTRDFGQENLGSAVLVDQSRLRLSPYARLQRFDLAVDEVMVRFRHTGEIVAQPRQGPVHLVFHPVLGRTATVGVTKVPAAMSSVLERSTTGSALHELLSQVPAQMQAQARAVLEKLVAIRVLDLE